jgi:hypothetical protein
MTDAPWYMKQIENLLADAAGTLERASHEINAELSQYKKDKDLEHVVSAANIIGNIQQNLRLDLFVRRALRAQQGDERQ